MFPGMKKSRSLLLTALFVISVIDVVYFLFFHNITESRYNKIMCYYLARSVTAGMNDFNDKVTALRDFVHENVHPVDGYYNRPDTVAIDELERGIGWCDQQSRVFMQLAGGLGIPSRLLFLVSDSGPSPHSIAEALTPDKRWILVDPFYKLDLINKDGNFATQADIKNDLTILENNKRIKSRARFKNNWADDKYISMYTNTPNYIVTREGTKFDFLRFVPVSCLRPFVNIIQNHYLDQFGRDIKDIYRFRMLKARAYHLLGYYDNSEKLYDEVIKNSGNLKLIRKAQFYYAKLLKDTKKYTEALEYIGAVIDKDKENPYLKYLYGMRAGMLERLGKTKEAEEDLLKIEYLIEAY